jgi:hypothetical protein
MAEYTCKRKHLYKLFGKENVEEIIERIKFERENSLTPNSSLLNNPVAKLKRTLLVEQWENAVAKMPKHFWT